MGSSGSPPSYPGLSAEERNILSKQGVTLDQMNKILSQESIDSGQNQDLLRQLSGLYTSEDTSAVPGEVTVNSDVVNFLSRIGDDAIGVPRGDPMWDRVVKSGIAGGRNTTGNQVLERLRSDPNNALALGFATRGAETPAGKKFILNQAAVEDLRKRVSAGQATQQELTDLETGIYKEGLLGLQSQLPQIMELNKLTLERQKKALEGTLPVSEGLMSRKTEDFIHLREAAARRGIQIEGDSPESATSQSSAGNELVGQFNRTYGLLMDAERRGEITGAPQQVYTPGPASQTSSYGQQLGFATSPGAGGLLGAYGNLANQYGGAAAPYINATNNAYQSLLNQYMQGASNRSGTASLIGMGIGGLLALPTGGMSVPVGAGLGAAAGGYGSAIV